MTSERPGSGPSDQATVRVPTGRPAPAPASPRRTTRLVGVDVARGLALLGMIAVHVFDEFDERGNPSLTTVTAGGRSAALFALLAGLGLALLTGGRRPVEGTSRAAAAAGLAVRALLVGSIGLLAGELFGAATGVAVILPYYGMLFLLAIPLLGMRARNLAVLTAALVAVAPVVVLWTVADVGDADLDGGGNLTFTALFDDPGGFLAALMVTGTYPVLIYLVYLAAGMALGRLDLSRGLVGAAVATGGLALAVGSRLLSELLLFRAGGVGELLDEESPPRREVNQLLWNSDESVDSWWYFVVPAPHSGTPFDLLNTLGSGMAVLGVALLVCRLGLVVRLLGPLAAAGSMTLTLYVGHLLILATGVIDEEVALYVVMVAGVLGFGHLWRRNLGQGPLERMVASGAGLARRSVAARQHG
jgi:hypothetical protein